MLLSALFIFSIQGHTSEKTRGQWASAANFLEVKYNCLLPVLLKKSNLRTSCFHHKKKV